MPREYKVLTTKGNVYTLPLKNNDLEESEDIIATDSEGGFLATTIMKGDDFTWNSLTTVVDSDASDYSPLRVNTFEEQLNYQKHILQDALMKIEFLEKLVGGDTES